MSTPNAVELSPLTITGLVRRITSDRHPARSEWALCHAVTALAFIAEGKLTATADADRIAAQTAKVLRGLALAAKPEEDVAELIAAFKAAAKSGVLTRLP